MLTVFWQDDEGDHEARIEGGVYRIGRAANSDLLLADGSVSRRHASLTCDDGDWLLEDLGSQNGTSVNGMLIREHIVSDGDTIRFGQVEVLFVESVDDSLRLEDDATQLPEVTQELLPGSIVLSANDVAKGKVGQTPGDSGLQDEVALALSKLTTVARSLITARSLPDLFDCVLDVVLANSPVEHAFLLLHDKKTNQLVPKAGIGKTESGDFPISRDIATRVFRDGNSILTLDAMGDARFASESIVNQCIRSVMCVPLMTHDSTLGVIFAGSTNRRVDLKEHHLHLLTVIANLAAVAIDQLRMRRRMEEELVIRSRLTRYHSPTLVDQLLSNTSVQGNMAPMEREVSVLFADIVSFSSRTEHMAPAQVSRLLNGLFSELVEIIFAHGGTLDKFLGDGLMAIFGAPNDLPDHRSQAVECAMAMQQRVAELDVREGADTPVQLRIGINSGMAVAGDIGSERRVEYTVLGNTVNVASRLESLVAQPNEIVIGSETHTDLGEDIATEPLGPQTLKGISEPVPAFRVVTGVGN